MKPTLKLYLITRPDEPDWDEYEGAVVVARSPSAAKRIHPDDDWVWGGDRWVHTNPKYIDSAWITPDRVQVQYLGAAKKGLKEGQVIIADFKAG